MKHIFIFICLLYVALLSITFVLQNIKISLFSSTTLLIQFFVKILFQLNSFKVGLSPSKKICVICLIENYKKCFLFHLKSSFRSKDISVFVTTFWSYRKNGLIRKTRLTSEFMTSQSGLETIAIHILPNISQSIGNQTIKFGQLIKYNEKYFSSKIMQKTR